MYIAGYRIERSLMDSRLLRGGWGVDWPATAEDEVMMCGVSHRIRSAVLLTGCVMRCLSHPVCSIS